MNYYKSTELAEKYGVSRRTITNWVEQTRQGRLDLELCEDNGRHFILKSHKNQLAIRQLVTGRRKFLNKRSLKHVRPLPQFYETYSEQQILEIISGIDTYREIELKFTYINNGATGWDAYAKRLYSDSLANSLNSTVKLLNAAQNYLDEVFKDYTHVNVVDIGVGNSLPVKNLLAHLLDSGKLKRYAAIDISQEMLDIAQKNIKEWFGDKVNFEGHVYDISYELFANAIAEPPAEGSNRTVNLVLLLGGTLANFDSPDDVLRVIRKSMSRNDLFAYSLKLDSVMNREQFHFIGHKDGQLLYPQCEFVLNMLGINRDLYDVEMGYNEQERARYIRIRLKYALTLEFNLPRGNWRLDLNKDETIGVWRARHNNPTDIMTLLTRNGFTPLHISQTVDHDYMVLISDLQKESISKA
ncbi:MAG TPA: L-histidine N(alpha)-methyltransferase [Candidatus Saccharimonadales bacterium]